MALTYYDLEPGFEFPSASFTVDAEAAKDYFVAVGSHNPAYTPEDLAPPALIAALAMAAFSDQVPFPPGTVHLTQEISLLDTVKIGERLTSKATLSRSQKRASMHLANIDVSVQKQNGQTALTGKIGFLLPQNGATIS